MSSYYLFLTKASTLHVKSHCQAHLKNDPLKYLLSKTMLTGHMAKWVMFLSEFDI